MVTSDVKRDAHEPTGEPETLAGRIKHKMGDRVQHTKPEGLSERKERSKRAVGRLVDAVHRRLQHGAPRGLHAARARIIAAGGRARVVQGRSARWCGSSYVSSGV